MGNVTNEIAYPCLETLIKVYSIQELYAEEERDLLSYSINKDRLEFLRRLELVQNLRETLLDVYDNTLDEMKICE